VGLDRGSEKFFKAAAKAFFRGIAQGPLYGRVNCQEHTVQIMDAHEPKAFFHQQAIQHQLLFRILHCVSFSALTADASILLTE
jgi:hypothetical protein